MLCKLSINNIRKSFKDYGIYFITLILGVCIFYIFNSLDSQTAMLEVSNNTYAIIELLMSILSYISVFISFVLGLLIIYASRFLMKKRNKEFGIYMILGMSKKKISYILLLETILIGLISLIVGLLLGIVLSQITSIFIANLFEADMSKYVFNFSSSALIKTCIYYGIIYIIVMLFNTINISKNKLINLLQASKKQEKIKIRKPIISVSLFIISVIMLGVAYYLVTNGINYLEKYDVIILLVPISLGIVGTITFYYSVAGMFLKILQNTKSIYYKGINTFTIKQISSKINTMIISISVICIMLFFTLCLLTSAFTIKNFFNNSINTYAPVSFLVSNYLEQKDNRTSIDIINNLKQNQELYKSIDKKIEITEYYDEEFTYGKSFGSFEKDLENEYPFVLWDSLVEIISLNDYNKVAKMYDLDQLCLNKDEYIIASNFNSNYYKVPLQRKDKLTVFNNELSPKYDRPIDGFINIGANPTNMALIIVDESIINKETTNYQNIVIGNYKKSITIEQEREFNVYLNELKNKNNYLVETKIDIKDNSVGLSALVTFIGLYVGIIFLITSSAILALKQLSDCIDDKNKYKILSQIGVEEKSINKSLFYQTLIFFLAPLTLALIHTIFGLKFCVLMLNTLGINNIFKDFIFTLIFLIIIYGLYFIVTYYCSKNIIREKN